MPVSLASNSAPMKGALVPIAYAYASTTTGTFTFNNIPQNYQDLFVVVFGRSDIAATLPSGLSLYTQQASATANYSVTGLYGDGSSAASNRATTSTPTYGFQSSIAVFPGSTATSGIFGAAEAHFLNYANTTTYKTCLMRTSADLNGSGVTTLNACLWQSTAAITLLTVATYGNFVAGSSAALYGIRTVGQ